MERRRDLRFEIRLTCRLQRLGETQNVEATTLNMSRSGALVFLARDHQGDALPQPGDAVLAEVPLPAHRLYEQRCFACKGTAVRVDEGEEGWVVAVQFDHIEFRPLAAAAVATTAHQAVM